MSNLILALVPILVLFGAINTIQLKLQNIQIDSNTQTKFFHPFMQTVCMLIGETLVGLLYLITYLRKRNQKQQHSFDEKKPAAEWRIMLPAVMDLLSTLLSYTALNMVDSSVWQISRGGNIITTALLSRCFLKRIFSSISILGCFLAFMGITSVQVVAVIYGNSSGSKDSGNQIIGIALLLASIVFNSCGLVYQKWIFNKFEMSPLKMVFLQGLFGLILMGPLIFAFQYIPCPWNDKSQCVKVGDDFYLENISNFWREINSNQFLFILNFGLILSIAISVPIAVTVSKKISPVSRSLADVCRTVLIWAFGIIMALTYGVDRKQYQLQSTDVLVNILKGIGFLILIFGTLLYHQLIPLPCLIKKQTHQGTQSLLLTESQSESCIKTSNN